MNKIFLQEVRGCCRSVDICMMEILKILDVVVELNVCPSHKDMEEMIQQQWRSVIKTWNTLVEKKQDVADN